MTDGLPSRHQYCRLDGSWAQGLCQNYGTPARTSKSRISNIPAGQKTQNVRRHVSAITLAELEFGSWNSPDYKSESDAARRAMAPFEFLPFDAGDCAMQYGRVRHSLESAGTPIGSLDTLIGAHALAIGAILVTADTLEFSRVPGLKCENWAQ